MLRTVYLKLHAAWATEAARADTAATLRAMLAAHPLVQAFVVGVPADEASARAWDLAVHVTLGGPAQVEAYLTHPVHEAWEAEFGSERVTFVKAWNFHVES